MGDAIAEEYKSSLADLNCNSKLHINVLTILAEENIKFAANIVDTIIQYTESCPPDMKLPCLYLIDSIIKNVGLEYLPLFIQQIVIIFASVFQKVDERTRTQMYKLRLTWNSVFPNNTLYALDVRTQQVDPAWPINAQPPPQSIHINPKFLGASATTVVNENTIKVQQQIVLKQLLDKQQQLKLLEEKKRLINPKSAQRPVVIAPVGPTQLPSHSTSSNSTVGRSLSATQVAPTSAIGYNQPNAGVLSKLSIGPSQNVPHNISTLTARQNEATVYIAQNVGVRNTQASPHDAPPKVTVATSQRDPRQRDPRRAAISNRLTSVPFSNTSQTSPALASKVINVISVAPVKVKPVTFSETKSFKESLSKGKETLEVVKNIEKKNESVSSDKKIPVKLKSDIKVPVPLHVEPHSSSHKEKNAAGKKRKKSDEQKKVSEHDKQVPITSDVKSSPKKSSKERSSEKKKISPKEKKSCFHMLRNQVEEKKYARQCSRSPIHKTDKKSPKNHGSSRDPRQRKQSVDHFKRKLDLNIQNNDNEVDVDLRCLFTAIEDDRSSKGVKRVSEDEKKEDMCEPPEKKPKEDKENANVEDSLFGSEDQDYRQLTKSRKKGTYEGWATYKKAHPDEFKSPLRHSRESIDSIQSTSEDYGNNNEKNMLKMPSDVSLNEMEYDRLGRPRLHRMRQFQRSESFQGYAKRDGSFQFDHQSNSDRLHHLLDDPKDILRLAEERYQVGIISKTDFDDIQRGLENVSRSKELLRLKEHGPNRPMQFSRFMKPEFKNSPERICNDYNHLPPKQDITVQGPNMPLPAVRTIRLDEKLRKIHFVEDKAFVLMDNDEPRQLMFEGNPTEVYIEGLKPILLHFDGKPVEFELDGTVYSMKFGAPSRELYVNNYPYEGKFGGPPFPAMLGNGRVYDISLGGPPPIVQVSKRPCYALHHKYINQNDIDMRMKPSIMKKDDTDWRHMGQNNDQELQNVNIGPAMFIKTEPSDFIPPPSDFQKGNFGSRPNMYPNNHQEPQEWKQDYRPLPSEDSLGTVQLNWRHSPFQDVQMANSPRNTPPRDIPPHPDDWEQPIPPRPFNPEQRHEPLNRQWMPRNFGTGGPRFVRPPGPDCIFHAPQERFEDPQHYPKTYPKSQGPPNFRLPLRPPFTNRTRPEFNKPSIRTRLPPPVRHLMPPWRQPRGNPSENQRHPVLLPPPRPPIHMRVPGPTRPEVPISSASGSAVLPVVTLPSLSRPASNSSFPEIAPKNLSTSSHLNNPNQAESSTSVPAPTQPIDICSLFSKLLAAGIISKPSSEEPETVVKTENDSKEENEDSDRKEEKEPVDVIPPIDLKLECLKVKQPGLINFLYRGSQCATCGMRFKEKGEKYSRHLDWHFRMNRREKDGVKKAFSRKWYYEVEDWIQFEEFEDFEERAPSFFELQADQQFQVEPVTEVPSVPVSGQENESCVVCRELFQLFWVEEEEEWHLRNAVRHDEQAYHPSCYEDHIKASREPDTIVDEKPSVDPIIKEEDIKKEPIDEKDIKPEPIVIKEEHSDTADIKETEDAAEHLKIKNEIAELVEALAEATVLEDENIRKEELMQGKPGEEEVIGLISECDMETEVTPMAESEKVVFECGGIVMKVRAESLKPSSPLVENVGERETAIKESEESEGEDEFKPPTPDPRFQVLPPVQRGTELSGLCSIM